MACASLQIQFRFRFKICMRNQDALADGCRARLHHTSRSSSQDFLPRKANQKYLVKANERPIHLEPSQKTHVITQAANFDLNMGIAWYSSISFYCRNLGYFDRQPLTQESAHESASFLNI